MATPSLHLVLYQPEIPHNTGSIGRTCVAVGAKLWLVRPLGFRLDDYHLRRAGLDYWDHLEWEAIDDWETLVRRLVDHRFWYLSKTAGRAYTAVGFRQGDVVVLGSESRGLPPLLLADQEHCLRIPMEPRARSLNLAVSAAVVAFEARRQIQAAAGAGREQRPVSE